MKKIIFAVFLLLGVATTLPASAGAVPEGKTQTATPAKRETAAQPVGEASDYAQREKAAPELANFKGGDTVVIGASTLVLVLLIVIIVILI
jgi:hypothetical protein